jgi:hypothetical protein
MIVPEISSVADAGAGHRRCQGDNLFVFRH